MHLQDNSSDDEPLIISVTRSLNQNKRKREDEEDEEEAQNKDVVSRKKKSRFAPNSPGDNPMLISSELCFEALAPALITPGINLCLKSDRVGSD